MTETLTALVAGEFSEPWAGWLGENTRTDWKILSWKDGDPFAEFAAAIVDADAIVAGNIRGDWPAVPQLRLYHVPFTGFEWLDAAKLPGACTVCNCSEHEIAMSEYVLGVMLERQIGFRNDDRYFREHGWKDRPPGGGPAHGELYGKTIGIVGYGVIGREVAARAAAFGMTVVGISRTAPKSIAPLDWFDDMSALPRLLRESDFVLMTLPLSDQTRGIFDAKCFASMKPDALFINVGRGMTVDEEALYTALAERRIGGAVIDVWFKYPSRKDPLPAPSRFRFQDLDNVLMTPHNSARTEETATRRWRSVAANLDRLARGEALRKSASAEPANRRARGTRAWAIHGAGKIPSEPAHGHHGGQRLRGAPQERGMRKPCSMYGAVPRSAFPPIPSSPTRRPSIAAISAPWRACRAARLAK